MAPAAGRSPPGSNAGEASVQQPVVQAAGQQAAHRGKQVSVQRRRHAQGRAFRTHRAHDGAGHAFGTRRYQGHHLGELWRRAQKTGENKIDESLVLKLFEIANWSFGIAGFVSFLVGLGMLAFVSVAAIDASTENDLKAPSVIETFPTNGSIDVDPSINEIAVTFDEEMMDGNWSWAYTNKNKFPEMNGQPYYVEKFTKNILPVKLESNKEYEIWINSKKFKKFKDKAGNSATPFKWVFKTK